MTWTKQRHGPSDHRYIIDEANRFIASMDNEATDEEWAIAVAAPELLKILERIINRATAPMSNGDILLSDVDAARAVIAKATAK
jgi:hypothetical protein